MATERVEVASLRLMCMMRPHFSFHRVGACMICVTICGCLHRATRRPARRAVVTNGHSISSSPDLPDGNSYLLLARTELITYKYIIDH
jgi:hypothetical protein